MMLFNKCEGGTTVITVFEMAVQKHQGVVNSTDKYKHFFLCISPLFVHSLELTHMSQEMDRR